MAASTDTDHNVIDTTSLNNVLDRLTLFLLSESVIVMTAEESGHGILLRDKYHTEAAGRFLFSSFCPIF